VFSTLAAAQQPKLCYRSTDLGLMTSGAYDLGNTGLVVGQTERWDETLQAFSARPGHTSPLPTLGGKTSSAQGVNSVGEVVGVADLADGTSHPVVWWRGRPIDLGLQGGTWGIATDVNEFGDIVSCIDGRVVAFFGGKVRSLDLPDASFMWPTGINSQRHIVSLVQTQDGVNHAFLYRDGQWANIDTPGGSAFPSFINERDIVCGGGQFDSGYHAFLRKGDATLDLDPSAKSGWSQCEGVNDFGFAVGTFGTPSGDRAFLWRNPTEGFLDLNALAQLPTNAVLTNAHRINDLGQIAAIAAMPDGSHAILLTPMACSR
jgi:probable HAF family extracellular repeat protein